MPGKRPPQILTAYDRVLRAEFDRKHHEERLSLEAIAKGYGISVVDLTRQMRRLGVPVRRVAKGKVHR